MGCWRYQEIIYTEDGGANWQENTSAGGPPGILFTECSLQMKITDGAVGDGETILYHTGSMTDPWTVQSPGLTAGFYPLFGLYFSDEITGWAVGENLQFFGPGMEEAPGAIIAVKMEQVFTGLIF